MSLKETLGQRLTRGLKHSENGQLLIVAAVGLAVMLGFAAMAIDVGSWLHTRTKLQADADAMALAGAQRCEQAGCLQTAIDTAAEYGGKNLHSEAEVDFIRTETEACFGDCGMPSDCAPPSHRHVTVQVTRTKAPFLAQVLGVGSADIRACATAVAAEPTTLFAVTGFGQGVRPFALDERCMKADSATGRPAVEYGSTVILKFDSDGKGDCQTQQGNFAAIGIDGSGADVYENTIKYGSNNPLCTKTTPQCCTTLSSSSCVGSFGVYLVPTETGNMIGKTKTGIDFLMSKTPSGCQTWNQVQVDGELVADCMPWSSTYAAEGTRILIVPVVEELWGSGGKSDVTIVDFAILYLEGYDGNCTGNSCDIKARFIRSMVSTDWVSAKSPCGGDTGTPCPDTTTFISSPAKLTQ
jgi:hypothetical protein